MAFTDDIPGIHDITINGGAAVPRRSVLNIIGSGVLAVDNQADGRTDITIPASPGGATITPTALAANVNDYSPTGHSSAAVERWSSGATPRTVTGLNTSGLARLTVINIGATTITLAHESASSSAAHRFACPGSTNYSLLAAGAVDLVYDSVSTRWRVVT